MSFIDNFNREKLKTCIKLCWLLLFITWIFTLVTGKHIEIVVNNPKFIEICNFIDSSEILTLIVKYLMYTVQSIIFVYAMLNVKILTSYKRIILPTISGIWVLKTVLHNLSFISLLDLLYIILVIIINKKRWLHSIIGTVLVLLISYISLYVKNISFDNDVLYNIPSIVMSIYSIDVYFMCILYYLYVRKGGFSNGKLVIISWKRKEVEDCNNSSSDSSSRTSRSFIGCNSIKQLYCKIIFFIIVYGLLVFIASFNNHIIEMTIIVICFHIFRDKDTKTYHAFYGSDIECFIESIISFSIVSSFEFSFQQSIYCSIMIAYVVSTVAYFVQDYIDYRKSTNELKSLTPETLDGICIKYNISDVMKQRLKLRYIDKLSIKEIANIEKVEEQTIKMSINRVKKRLRID